MAVTVYGIPNCDSVKKALGQLKTAGILHTFHDFRKAGLNASLLETWLQQVPLDILINRKGSTWRQLSESEQAAAGQADTAIALLLEKPALIKRPVIDTDGRITVGHLPT